jgi:two-component system sensor kinase FixL
LRRLVSRQEETRSFAAIDEVIDEVKPIIVADARMHEARVSFVLQHSLPKLSVDRVQIQHALINLLRNSFEALQENPRLQREVTIETRLNEDREVEIDVRDNGPGVPSTLRGRLFEPFFTTKPAGSGLGLSICRTIAEAHAGTLDYHDGQLNGAVFRMRLPVPTEED